MVLPNKWNRQLELGTKLQSSLGRVAEVYKEQADSLIMARVVKVNFIYNTVDVVTIRYTERLMKDADSQGKFSAQLPVSFGGQFSNGDTYGQTVPVNVGDTVLIGFLDKDKKSPIVINIYKSTDVSFELAPTDKVSGDPEDGDLSTSAFETFTLFPSQTYNWRDGDGNLEQTYQGKTFLKSSVSGTGNGRLNDYGYGYEQLFRTYLRGRNITPYVTTAPQTLFQHTGDNIDFVNNFFMDDNGDFRLSTYSKSTGNRVGLSMKGTDDVYLSYQQGDAEEGSEDDTKVSKVGIEGGVPLMSYKDHSITFNDLGMLIDGVPLAEWSGHDFDQRMDEVEAKVAQLKAELDSLNADQINARIDAISDQINTALLPSFKNLTDTVEAYDGRIQTALDTATRSEALANQVARTISDAAGSDSSLLARLDRIDQTILALQDIIKEVVASRTFNIPQEHTYVGVTGPVIQYESLGKRLDLIEDYVRTDRDRLNDLVNRLDVFLSNDFDKGVASYVVTIKAYGDVVMRNGQGSVTLEADLYKGGFLWTGLVDDGAFVWTRNSGSSDTASIESDMTWNQNHLDGAKSITLTALDFGYSANFTVSVTVQGHLIQS